MRHDSLLRNITEKCWSKQQDDETADKC